MDRKRTKKEYNDNDEFSHEKIILNSFKKQKYVVNDDNNKSEYGFLPSRFFIEQQLEDAKNKYGIQFEYVAKYLLHSITSEHEKEKIINIHGKKEKQNDNNDDKENKNNIKILSSRSLSDVLEKVPDGCSIKYLYDDYIWERILSEYLLYDKDEQKEEDNRKDNNNNNVQIIEKPKKVRSAFNFFIEDHKNITKKEDIKKLYEDFKKLRIKDKKIYEDKVEEDKKRYNVEKKKYIDFMNSEKSFITRMVLI